MEALVIWILLWIPWIIVGVVATLIGKDKPWGGF